jgi:hypothetical protein
VPKIHHVQSARKDQDECDVKIGESYYWWKIKTGPASSVKRCSKTYPPPNRLTHSPFLRSVYSVQEDINSVSSVANSEELQSLVDGWTSSIQQIADEAEQSYNAMPENLRDTSNVGTMLYERSCSMDAWREQIEAVDIPDESMFGDDADVGAGDFQDALAEALAEIQAIEPDF